MRPHEMRFPFPAVGEGAGTRGAFVRQRAGVRPDVAGLEQKEIRMFKEC